MNPIASRDNTSSWVNRHHSPTQARSKAAESNNGEETPLIEMSKHPRPERSEATLAKITEIDDLDHAQPDERPVWNAPRAGVDDGFFDHAPGVPLDKQPEVPNLIPSNQDRRTPSPHPPASHHPDEFDGRYAPRHPHTVSPFPHAPGFGPDLENGIIIPDLESIPDVNQYQHRKTLAQGMMDLALFSANANQLRYVLESFDRHPYYYPSLILISFSIILQIAIGLGLILNSRYNVKNEKEICIANRINNYTVIGIFLVTAVNVFVSAFGVANAPVRFVPNSPPLPVLPLPTRPAPSLPSN